MGVSGYKAAQLNAPVDEREKFLHEKAAITFSMAIGANLNPGASLEEYKSNFQAWGKANASDRLHSWVYTTWFYGMNQKERNSCVKNFGKGTDVEFPNCVLSFVCPANPENAKKGCLCWQDPSVPGCIDSKMRDPMNYIRPISVPYSRLSKKGAATKEVLSILGTE